MKHDGGQLETRAELPWLIGAVTLLLGAWFCYNRYYLHVYPADLSENGRFHVLTYGSDFNPARADQLNKFNQHYRKDNLKMVLVPGGSDVSVITTTSAAKTATDIIEAYSPEIIRTFIQKGIARPLNEYLKANKIDLESFTWPTRLDEMRVPNPNWKTGDAPLDRHIYYAVPNNLEVTMVFFNQSLYDRVKEERQKAGQVMPPPPWLNWTWWDYAALANALHRRGDSGRFISFGGAMPEFDILYHQIGASMRGLDRARFDALSPQERAELGIHDLSWDECTLQYRDDGDGRYTMYPNRAALEQALQYQCDLIATFKGSPSGSDYGQMASGGSFNGNGNHGQFLSGVLGMHLMGRWFLGQVRAGATFDWRLYRAPRWVPLSEWERWQRERLEPAKRDGEWGEIEHPLRGYTIPLGGRMACISSSSKDPAKAFKFLEFLATNEDFNRILLVEDGMGADMKVAYDYLSRPDPLFPHETINRPVEHELGALSSVYARERWPFTNYGLGRDQVLGEIGTFYSDQKFIAKCLAASPERLLYTGMQRYIPATLPSTPVLGRDLSIVLTQRLDTGIAEGAVGDAPAHPAGPSAVTLAVLAGFVSIIALLALPKIRSRYRRETQRC
jgi:ABC-type glycerol-3-phosphate transport system substrate-binding protein